MQISSRVHAFDDVAKTLDIVSQALSSSDKIISRFEANSQKEAGQTLYVSGSLVATLIETQNLVREALYSVDCLLQKPPYK